MKHLFILFAFAIVAVSCTKKEKQIEVVHVVDLADTKALQAEILDLQKKNELLQNKLSQTALTQAQPQGQYNDGYLKNFCSFLHADLKVSEIAPYVAPVGDLKKTYLEPLLDVANKVKNCQFSRKLSYDYPFDFAEYKIDGGFLYLEVRYDENLKVTSFNPARYKEPLRFTVEKVIARDGTALTSYVIHPLQLSEKWGTMLMRTPYMNNGGYWRYSMMALAAKKVLVVQANRGSHSSQGEFQWLHSVNLDDAEDTIEWIGKQTFSNQKVVSYGVSYDGYNALASAGNNPKGLVGVIACSAPANAATDSFTSSKFVEKYLLPYVSFDRQSSSVYNNQWVQQVFESDISPEDRKDLDLVVSGQKVNEWQSTNAAIDDDESPYWKERSLYSVLAKTTVPILHMAGLFYDQDGRDTLLAYEQIQKNSPLRDQHYLVLHSDGHGCGRTMDLPIFKKMLALADGADAGTLASEPQVLQYKLNTSAEYFSAEKVEDLPLAKKVFALEKEVFVGDYKFLKAPQNTPGVFEQEVDFILSEPLNINGSTKLKIKYVANAPEVPLHLFLAVKTLDGKVDYFGWRTALISKAVGEEDEQTVIFPLHRAQIPAGATLSLMMTTHYENVFIRDPQSRKNFKPATNEVSGVRLLLGTELIVPTQALESVAI